MRLSRSWQTICTIVLPLQLTLPHTACGASVVNEVPEYRCQRFGLRQPRRWRPFSCRSFISWTCTIVLHHCLSTLLGAVAAATTEMNKTIRYDYRSRTCFRQAILPAARPVDGRDRTSNLQHRSTCCLLHEADFGLRRMHPSLCS